jgi:hypothetical protein
MARSPWLRGRRIGLSIAKFWAMPTGTLIAGFWNSTASELIERHRFGEREAAHALALMNTAAAVGLPNFPAYPSNHACFSGAAAYVLGSLFPDDRQRLRGMAYDAGLSRVFGGIHDRFDSDVGLEIARKITRLALESDRRNQMLDLLR